MDTMLPRPYLNPPRDDGVSRETMVMLPVCRCGKDQKGPLGGCCGRCGCAIPDVLPDRGYLLGEPCRYCHRAGGVYFIIDDSSFGKSTPQVVACDKCKNTWTVDGSSA